MDSEDIDEPDGVGGAAAVKDSEEAAAGPDDHEGDVVQSPEEEEEMATTVKVIKGIMNELLLPSHNQYPIHTDRRVYA